MKSNVILLMLCIFFCQKKNLSLTQGVKTNLTTAVESIMANTGIVSVALRTGAYIGTDSGIGSKFSCNIGL